MKRTKSALRVWMASVSLGGFLGGWVLLAHAPKPASTNSSGSTSSNQVGAAMPTLTPLPPIGAGVAGNSSSGSVASMPTFRSRSFLPVMRTHGS